jgi:hypothetical protein
MVNVTGPGGGPGFVDNSTTDPTLAPKPTIEKIIVSDTISDSGPGDGQRLTGSGGTVGAPGQDITLEDGDAYDTESLGREMTTSDWLSTSYNVAFFSNMQEALDNIAESERTEAFASREAAVASFENSMAEAELTLQKSETEAEKLMTSALTSLCMSVGTATLGLATSFAASKMTADAAKEKNAYKQFQKDYPDANNPEASQASYETRQAQWEQDRAAYNDYKTAGHDPEAADAPRNPGGPPLTPEQQQTKYQRMQDENGGPRYIEMERRATNASNVSSTIINNIGRTIPDVVSNLIQASFTVQIGQMEMQITILKALESMYDRQKQNATTAESAQRDQFSEFVRALQSVIDSRLQAFRLQGG